MDAVVDIDNYHFDLLGLPFATAAVGLFVVSIYLLLMRGAPLLRATCLVSCTGFSLVTGAYALASWSASPVAAAWIYKFGLALMPTGAAAFLTFQILLTREIARYRKQVLIALISSLLQAPFILVTDLYIDGVWQSSNGLWHYRAGPLAPLLPGSTALWLAIAIWRGRRWLRREVDPTRRRQLRGTIMAFTAIGLGLFDTPIAYGLDIYPISWMCFGVGAFFAFRTVILDDLVRSTSLDSRGPLALLYLSGLAAAIFLVWRITHGERLYALVPMLAFVYWLFYLLVNAYSTVIFHAGSKTDPLFDRLSDQYATRVRSLTDASEIGLLTGEAVELGLGRKRVTLLLASAQDWSWRTLDGTILPEDSIPDPLTLGWFLENHAPLERNELQGRRLGDFREPIENLFRIHEANVLVPLVNRDDMIGMLVIGNSQQPHVPFSAGELRFITRIQETTTEALIYARMHREANSHIALVKQVELAATVQSAFVPSSDLIDYGDMQVCGVWAPASHCGGDWWWAHQMPDGRVLVLIGDVTGHGVPAAMITAAAKGCYDIAQRLMGSQIDAVELLGLLDRAVRSMGGQTFHMTCFVTIVDPALGTATYANAGHLVPYICQPREDGSTELRVLAARGTPLGAGKEQPHRASTRQLKPGAVLIWYTDGIIECVNRNQEQFGDRRFQRLLRKLPQGDDIDVTHIRDHIVRTTVAFQGGMPADDDITLVVARLGNFGEAKSEKPS